jgi:hypothetical protein
MMLSDPLVRVLVPLNRALLFPMVIRHDILRLLTHPSQLLDDLLVMGGNGMLGLLE